MHYVRSDDVVDAAWEAGIGVHALIWVCSSKFIFPWVANTAIKVWI